MKKIDKEKLDEFLIQVDNREQVPWLFGNRTVFKSLPAGDYTVIYNDVSYQDKIVIERKSSVSELFQATGRERERFERELEKLAVVKYKWIVCEFDYLAIVNEQPPGILQPIAVYGSILAWHVKFNVPFFFAGNRKNARASSYKLLENYVKYKILELK